MFRFALYLVVQITLYGSNTLATNFFSRLCCCQNPGEDCGLLIRWFPNSGKPPPPPLYSGCNARPPPGERWACDDDTLEMPTVDCIVKDMKTCNVIGASGSSHVFYSLGAGTVEVRDNVRDKLTPRGTMFNDGLMSDREPEVGWAIKVLEGHGGWNLGDQSIRVRDPTKSSNWMNRRNIFIARYSEALGRVATGKAYLVYDSFVGEGGQDDGLGGIYQLPKPDDPNDPRPDSHLPNYWRSFEIGELQRNGHITQIIGVDQTNNYEHKFEWEPGPGYREMPRSYAMSLEFPPLPQQPIAAVAGPVCAADVPAVAARDVDGSWLGFKAKRDDGSGGVCAYYGSGTSELSLVGTGTPSPSMTSNFTGSFRTTQSGTTQSLPGPTITPAPTSTAQALCDYVGVEPPAINTAYCSCQGAVTLPLTSIPGSAVPEASSCAYSSLPGTSADVTITDGLGPATTDKAECLEGTNYAFNGGDMTSIPGCLPQTAQATVEAGSSPVHVETLTGTALYTSISSALESICPSVTQSGSATSCATDTVTIKDIDYIDPVGSTLAKGELTVQVQSSSYNVTSLRDAMIHSAALTAQNSANGSNCYTAEFNTPVKHKRWNSLPFSGLPRRWLALDKPDGRESGLLERSKQLTKRPDVLPDAMPPDDMTLCNAAAFAGVQYFNPYW